MSIIGTEQPSNGLINQDAPVQAKQVDWESRYKELQSYHDKTRVGLESENSRLRKASSVFTPPKTAEELDVFRNENPDWMGVIESVAHGIAADSIRSLESKVNKAESASAAQELMAAHPDFQELTATEDFKQWATDQGPEIQAWLASEHDASKVIRALNYYKAMRSQSVPVAAPTQYNDPMASEAVSTHGSVVTPKTNVPGQQVFTREQIARMHPDDYERNHEIIQAQFQQGLIR